jgi:hypothetical protein
MLPNKAIKRDWLFFLPIEIQRYQCSSYFIDHRHHNPPEPYRARSVWKIDENTPKNRMVFKLLPNVGSYSIRNKYAR